MATFRASWIATAGFLTLGLSLPAEAENISIPGYGDVTLSAVGNAGVLVHDGTLGATTEGDTHGQLQTVKSLVGVTWVWDIGYSHKLLANYAYGGEFTTLDRTFEDAKPFRSAIGVSNALGAFTYGKQPTGFFKYYGGLIDRSQDFYATGYTTANAGGVSAFDTLKYSTSYGRLAVDVDYRPAFIDGSSPLSNSFGISRQYRQYLGRFTFGGGYLHQEFRSGANDDVNRFGGAVEYGSEQWTFALGAHVVDDASAHDTRSYNLLGTFQLTQDNALHLSLAIIDDDDIYDSFLGGGYYIDHRIGSQWRVYSEGAVTRAEAAGGGNVAVNTQILVGVRFDFGNIFY